MSRVKGLKGHYHEILKTGVDKNSELEQFRCKIHVLKLIFVQDLWATALKLGFLQKIIFIH